MIKLGSNIAALQAQRKLSETGAALSRTFERLSSGMRINRASDDPAGLAIANALNKDVRVYSQAIRNVNDGLSALNIAQGALEELSHITMRQKELATQAANGTYSLTQRRSMNTEANALVEEFNRIVESTEFNGLKLIDTSLEELRIQCGYGTEGSVDFAIGEELARTVGTGFYEAGVLYGNWGGSNGVAAGDFNGDGVTDVFRGRMCYLGNGNGTFKSGLTATMSNARTYHASDLNGDGRLDVAAPSGTPGYGFVEILLGQGNGTFQTTVTYQVGPRPEAADIGDFNGDNHLDIAAGSVEGNSVNVIFGNGNGSFRAQISLGVVGGSTWYVTTADIDQDGRDDLLAGSGSLLHVFLGNPDGSFGSSTFTGSFGGGAGKVAAADFNADGCLDAVLRNNGNRIAVLIGNGDGTFRAPRSNPAGQEIQDLIAADLNNDGLPDLAVAGYNEDYASALLNRGDGTFYSTGSFPAGDTPYGIAAADFNGDAAMDLATASASETGMRVYLAETRQTTTVARLNTLSADSARLEMSALDETLSRIVWELGAIGAAQSRLGVALNTLAAARENFAAAAGRIVDADIAEESSQLVRTQILQQAGAAVLTQANQQPALALRLLTG